ncbi:hypothetical protein DPEC_G00284460 [Dallia pectoralis]|uniref:Uncharacterized protein n=1 Tax=Dallia pectoralis TaxID=75939 RepID=A0ACC2FJE9_DALPE|nr:hypothetical protein DPEC_G00284460 [Dallia pectoralis]
MEVSHSIRERTIAENSLVILLQGLQGEVTTVDLRDESTARGRVVNVDAFMNVRLEEVLYRDRRGRLSQLADLFITGRNVRYVHIPDHVDIMKTIETQLARIRRVRNFAAVGQGKCYAVSAGFGPVSSTQHQHGWVPILTNRLRFSALGLLVGSVDVCSSNAGRTHLTSHIRGRALLHREHLRDVTAGEVVNPAKQDENVDFGFQSTCVIRMEPIPRDMELLSNSMATYAHIKANPESFALYFMMGVCFGLLLALCLLVTGITCRTRHVRTKKAATTPSPERRKMKDSSEEEEEEESVDVEDGEEADVAKVTVAAMSERSSQSNGTLRSTSVFSSAEELERARRLEERERIVREIWRNGQPDILATGTGTIGRVHYH